MKDPMPKWFYRARNLAHTSRTGRGWRVWWFHVGFWWLIWRKSGKRPPLYWRRWF